MNEELKIEFLPTKEEDSDLGRVNIVVNGIEDEDSLVFDFKNNLPLVRISNFSVIDELNSYSFSEVSKYLSRYEFYTNFEWTTEDTRIEISLDKEFYKEISINFFVKPDLTYWAKPWNFVSFEKEFKKVLNIFNSEIKPGLKFLKDEEGYGIHMKNLDPNSLIHENIQRCHDIVCEIYNETEINLLNGIDKNSLTSVYEFPEQIKSACKQYLIYFAQFLADLGINAETEIKEEANKTLFKVTPKDKTEALEKIKQILNIYLQAADNSNFEIIESENNFALQQWKANVYFLKSQIEMSKTMLQMKDATIETLQLSNFQLKEKLDLKTKVESKKENIIPEVLAVEELKVKGAVIDLPGIVRKLKRRFSGNKDV